MSRVQRVSFALFGIILGLLTCFSVDMVMNRGKYIAHHFKRYQPSCSISCHTLGGPLDGVRSSISDGLSLLCWDDSCVRENTWELQR